MLAEFYKAARGVLSPLPIVDVLRQTAPPQLHRRIAGRGRKIRLTRPFPPINRNNASTKMGPAVLRFTITLQRTKVTAPGNQLERRSKDCNISAGEGAHFSGTLSRASFRHTNVLGEAMAVAIF